LKFDTLNHALPPGETADASILVPVRPLDSVLEGQAPTLLKIDVEGFETEVLNGARDSLEKESLYAVLIESNGSGRKYGYEEAAIRQRLLDLDFLEASYLRKTRELMTHGPRSETSGNVLFVRRAPELQDRLKKAPRFSVGPALI